MNTEDAIIEEATALLDGRVADDGSWKPASASDQKKGFEMLLSLAESGNQIAQLKVGKCCLDGTGTPESEKAGVEWLERSASSGFDEALMEVGQYYLNQYVEHIDRTDKTLALAYDGMKKATDLGNRYAASKLEQCTPEYHRECEREFAEILGAAESGNPSAQKMIHFHYLSGYGVKRSDEKAAFWIAEFEKNKPSYIAELKKKADNGDQMAALELHVLQTGSALG